VTRVAARTLSGAGDYLTQLLAVADIEALKIRHDPVDLMTRAVQPVLWLTLFGQVMGRVRGLNTTTIAYLDFLAPGILAQAVLFVAIFHGISVIWERDLGVLHRYMASPAPRSALVLGKALSAAIRGLSQAVVIFACAAIIGVKLNWNPLMLLGTGLVVSLTAILFASFSLTVACVVKTRERFMGIGQMLNMPIFFASNAIYPVAIMPDWLRTMASVNPLSYAVDALRALMLKETSFSLGQLSADVVVLVLVTAAFAALATRLYPRLTD
jgi:ABC-2 type transport system permease protein